MYKSMIRVISLKKLKKKCFFGDRSPLSEGLDPPLHTYNKFTLNLDLNPESDYFL